MQYEPIKRSLGRFFSGPAFIRKIFYLLLHLLLLRSWHVYKALRKMRKELPVPASILDAGSGLGQYTWRMCRMSKEWKIEGVDINAEQIEDCKTFFARTGLSGRVSFKTADLAEFNDPAHYDLILSVDVMEHIKDDELVFRNFYNSLKNNGILLISTPSDRGGSDIHGDEDESFIDEHVRNGYSIGDISEKLNRAGFEKTEVCYTYGRAGNLSWLLSMKYPVKMLNASYLFFILLPLYYLIIFPVSIVLNIFDLCLKNKTGTGLLVIARKKQQ
jgi:SAM-dependent methyltransferase